MSRQLYIIINRRGDLVEKLLKRWLLREVGLDDGGEQVEQRVDDESLELEKVREVIR